MFTIFAFSLGFYASRRIQLAQTNGGWSLSIATDDLGGDIQEAWVTLAALAAWVIATGRNARAYCNGVLIPWVGSYGVQLPLVPALVLPGAEPKYPWESLTDADDYPDLAPIPAPEGRAIA
jgi:hypothetical protein